MVHYLDNAATTPVRPSALETMVPLLSEVYGNPSGAHRMARAANRVLDDARETMAEVLGAKAGEIVFTAGGTEADNLAVTGVLEANGGIALCTTVEHHAVLDPVAHSKGETVEVARDGRLDLAALEDALTRHGDDVSLVSVMAVNNETGMIQPLDEAIEMTRRLAPGAVFHTDAVQALCWLDLSTVAGEADMVSVSAHKFGGPKGVGCLVVREGERSSGPEPLLRGGGQERGRRGGTHNVAGIAAMATAAAETHAQRADQVPRVTALRDRLADGVLTAVPDAIETGDRALKTANIAHFCFPGVASEALLILLEQSDIMASAASSCSSGAMDPSHVLAAMGYSRDLAFGSLRLSLGYGSTDADVDATLAALGPAVTRLRERS